MADRLLVCFGKTWTVNGAHWPGSTVTVSSRSICFVSLIASRTASSKLAFVVLVVVVVVVVVDVHVHVDVVVVRRIMS